MSSPSHMLAESTSSYDTARNKIASDSARSLTGKILAIVDIPSPPSTEINDTMAIPQKHTGTIHQLADRRLEIDELDACIVRSFFDGSTPEQEMRCSNMTPEELVKLQSLGLTFSETTWQLVERRMQISQEIGNIKKQHGLHNHIVDDVRKKKVIEHAKSRAPEDARERIEALYEIIHDVSVRIQERELTKNN